MWPATTPNQTKIWVTYNFSNCCTQHTHNILYEFYRKTRIYIYISDLPFSVLDKSLLLYCDTQLCRFPSFLHVTDQYHHACVMCRERCIKQHTKQLSFGQKKHIYLQCWIIPIILAGAPEIRWPIWGRVGTRDLVHLREQKNQCISNDKKRQLFLEIHRIRQSTLDW